MFGLDIDDVLMSDLYPEPEETGDSFVQNPIPAVAPPERWNDHEVEYNCIFGEDWQRHHHLSIDLGLSTPGQKSWRLEYTLKKLGDDPASFYDIHDPVCPYIEDTSQIVREGWNTMPYNQFFSTSSGSMAGRRRWIGKTLADTVAP
jgi:hypothetical protein